MAALKISSEVIGGQLPDHIRNIIRDFVLTVDDPYVRITIEPYTRGDDGKA